MLGFYVFTGEDANSALRGKGKVIPLKKSWKHYRVAQFKCAHLNYPQTPHAKDHGWIPTNENEQVLEPVWSEGPILPDKLIDLITEDVIDSESCDEDEDSDESEMDCTSDEYDSD